MRRYGLFTRRSVGGHKRMRGWVGEDRTGKQMADMKQSSLAVWRIAIIRKNISGNAHSSVHGSHARCVLVCPHPSHHHCPNISSNNLLGTHRPSNLRRNQRTTSPAHWPRKQTEPHYEMAHKRYFAGSIKRCRDCRPGGGNG
jgi:hypothetical protein